MDTKHNKGESGSESEKVSMLGFRMADLQDDSLQSITRYIGELKQALNILPLEKIDQTISVLHEARLRSQQIFVMGNGGSASTASHFVCDLGKNTRMAGWPNYKVIGLSDNMAILSAYANDEGYENVFVNQLDSLIQPGDVVIGISTSGNSENVLRAIELARQRDAITIGFTGFDGGKLSPLVDIDVHVASDNIEQVEDIHLMLEHLITKVLREESQKTSFSPQVRMLFPSSVRILDREATLQLPREKKLRSQATLELFTAISQEIAIELNIRDLLRRVLQLTLDNIGATSGSIVVLSEQGDVVEGAIAYDGNIFSNNPQQLVEIVERGLAGWVMENRQAVVIENTQDDPRWLPREWERDNRQGRSAMSVPLVVNDRPVGVLTLVNSYARQFTHEDLSLLTTVAMFMSLVDYSAQ